MKTLVKQLIIDFHQHDIPKPVARAFDFIDFPKNIRKAQVFMGMRRTGKTWLMYQHMQQLLTQGRPKEKLLYLNFEDDRLLSFQVNHFQDVLLAYYELYPQYVNDSGVVFYFDEIHIIEGWEKFIRRLLDQEKMAIFVTGSSAKMLSKEIATSLRGRAIANEVFPFSFQEYLAFHQLVDNRNLTSKNQSLVRHHAELYQCCGGFPETLFLPNDQHDALLQDYVNAVVFRDVIERHQVNNVHAVKMFLIHCLQNLSSPLSITKIYRQLKSRSIIVGKNSLYEYLDYFEEAYLLFSIPIFDFSVRKRQANPKKIYAVDPGILTAYSIKSDFEQGALFENAVFLELRRKYQDIYYYRTKKDKEVDFVIVMPTGSLQLVQACTELRAASTREREISALIEAAAELNATQCYLITQDLEEDVQHESLVIHILPFWKWAMASSNQNV